MQSNWQIATKFTKSALQLGEHLNCLRKWHNRIQGLYSLYILLLVIGLNECNLMTIIGVIYLEALTKAGVVALLEVVMKGV